MEGMIRKRSGGGEARERLHSVGAASLSDRELFELVLGGTGGGERRRERAREAVARLLEEKTLEEVAWATADFLRARHGIGAAGAASLAAAFELGRRASWAPPRRGERILDPARVAELLRFSAHAERECFHVVLLDVRGRLLRTERVAEGSLTQCPVSPRDALRPAVRDGAHGVIFVHSVTGHRMNLM